MKKKIVLLLAVVLVIIQFFQIDKNPLPVVPSETFSVVESPPRNISEMLDKACMDCHGHSTDYPWYSYVQPVGWWLRGHGRGGRMHLDFDEWGQYDQKSRAHHAEEIVEVLDENRMPLKSYTWFHSESKLSEADKAALRAYFKAMN